MKTIGRYEVLAEIGQGGMGTVYRAFDPLLQRVVAVKVIAGALGPNPEMRERFFREARAAGQLTHKNIVVIHDLGEEAGQPFLAMEYLTGGSLESRIRQGGRLPVRDALRVTIEVCRGLEYAHSHGVVHRDIKPANLFVTDSGDVKILDFGLARLVTSELTRTEAVMGTANYMAPEQVRGERVDHRADIFAVGSVLYELLSGCKAFEADSFAATIFKIAQESPPPLRTRDATLPPELEIVVDRALAKRREERYQTTTEMLQGLTASLSLLDPRGVTAAAATSLPTLLPTVRVTSEHPAGAPPASANPAVAAATPARSMPWSPRRMRTTAIVGTFLLAALTSALLLQWTDTSVPRPQAPAGTLPGPVAAGPAPAALIPPEVSSTEASPTDEATTPAVAPSSSRTAPPPAASAPNRQRALTGPLAATVDDTPQRDAAAIPQGAIDRQPTDTRPQADAALGRLAASRAGAEAAGSRVLAAAQYQEASATEGEARSAHAAGEFTRAASLAIEADALYRGAEITARAEQAARDRLRAADAAAAVGPSTAPAAPRPDPVGRPVEQPPAVAPQQAIRALVRLYVAALEQRDLAALTRIWPSIGSVQQRALRAEFDNARSVQVALTDERIDVSGETVRMTALRRYDLVTTDGQRLSTTTRTTFVFSRSGADWIISDVSFEQP